MPDNPAYRSCIKNHLRYFFGSESRAASDMYAKRGMLAQEVRRQERKAQAAALMGIQYVPPKINLAAPARVVGKTPLAALAQGLVASQSLASASGAVPDSCSWAPAPSPPAKGKGSAKGKGKGKDRSQSAHRPNIAKASWGPRPHAPPLLARPPIAKAAPRPVSRPPVNFVSMEAVEADA
eukprot:12779016-Heterocapsa_arctica.AAC.1